MPTKTHIAFMQNAVQSLCLFTNLLKEYLLSHLPILSPYDQ